MRILVRIQYSDSLRVQQFSCRYGQFRKRLSNLNSLFSFIWSLREVYDFIKWAMDFLINCLSMVPILFYQRNGDRLFKLQIDSIFIMVWAI
jgi:hypothetical protein